MLISSNKGYGTGNPLFFLPLPKTHHVTLEQAQIFQKPARRKASKIIGGIYMAMTSPAKLVFRFGGGLSEGYSLGSATKMTEVLGGKGKSLQDYAEQGLNVPPGFTITADVGANWLKEGKVPPELAAQILEGMGHTENITGRNFGSSEDPLLVSVRSGGRVSMPGMMDTVLNLGLNEDTVEGLARMFEDRQFAFDSYRRFVESYGKVVLEIDGKNNSSSRYRWKFKARGN